MSVGFVCALKPGSQYDTADARIELFLYTRMRFTPPPLIAHIMLYCEPALRVTRVMFGYACVMVGYAAPNDIIKLWLSTLSFAGNLPITKSGCIVVPNVGVQCLVSVSTSLLSTRLHCGV